jgi:hypothetical protein
LSTKVDKATAIVFDYNGLSEITRVEYFDSSRPVFYFANIKGLDHKAIIAEMNDPDQPVLLVPMLRSMKRIDELLEKAKASGVWQKPAEEKKLCRSQR